MTNKCFKVEKLIRDKLPEIMRAKGIVVHETIMDEEDYIIKLKDKLQEETEEVKRTQNSNDLEEELGDILEVVKALAAAGGLSMQQIEKKQLEKRQQKGSFEEKKFISFVEINEDNPAIEYYLKNYTQSLLIQLQPHITDCIFCQMTQKGDEEKIVAKFPHCFAIYDRFPVSPGHVLIIPYEHTENWFTASDEVRKDIMNALNEMKEHLDLKYQPDGYNIGANCGEIAGQTVMHLHVHLIPRYQGDMEDPKGGVRGVIPSKQKY